MDTSKTDVLADAKKILIAPSQFTKIKILISVNFVVGFAILLNAASQLISKGNFNSPKRDWIYFPTVILFMFFSGITELYYLTKRKGIPPYLHHFLSYATVILLSIITLSLLHTSSNPPLAILFDAWIGIPVLISVSLIINRWFGAVMFTLFILNIFWAVYRIGFDYVYQTGWVFQDPKFITNLVIVIFTYFLVSILMLFFESGTIDQVLKAIPHAIEKIETASSEKKALEQIEILKNQQDGDYFLTSLILTPLGANRAKSENIKIDFLVEQKKKFTFKRWEKDIGGDICITDNIQLNNRNYIIFVNADAMGKSLQGAGGALVLGAAFKAIIERNKFSPEGNGQSPERWLKNVFIEMHSIFESFDGSMLASAIFGLIDDKNGFMYFINAEHPSIILYRDGTAGFVDSKFISRKLGSVLLNRKVIIQTIHLREKDVIIMGSDGRDDIKTGVSEEGDRIINEDKTMILRSVEKAGGGLKEIADEIKRCGELTDDLSLMRIEYTGNPGEPLDEQTGILLAKAQILERSDKPREAIALLETIPKEKKMQTRISRELFKLNFKIRDYANSAHYGLACCQEMPNDIKLMYMLCYSLRKMKEYTKAVDVGERIRLREPGLIKNLLNLSECYYRLKKFHRSATMVSEILSLEPDNRGASYMQHIIKTRHPEMG